MSTVSIDEKEIALFKSLFFKFVLYIFLMIWGYFVYTNDDSCVNENIKKSEAFNQGKELSCTFGGKTFIIAKDRGWIMDNNMLRINKKSVPLDYCKVISVFGE